MTLSPWWAWLVANPLLAWASLAVALWLLIGWGRGQLAAWRARRRRRQFDQRELRRWEGHRRERR